MDRFLDWIDRQGQKKADFPAVILAQRVTSEDEANRILVNLPLWTYRYDFSMPLPNSNLMTDRNWGCLIRTSQMLLSRTLQLHGDFREEYFRDVPEAPFSIHSLVNAVAEPHKEFEPKYWAPTQACQALRMTVAKATLKTPLAVVVPEQGCMYYDELVFALKHSPLLVLLPVRPCASERITQSVFLIMEHLFTCPLVVGIVGGVPRRSYYFVGICEGTQRIMYLDPHIKSQPAYDDAKDLGHHCEGADSIGCVDWKRIDSSLLVGVYLRSSEDLKTFKEHLENFSKNVDDLFLHIATTRAAPRCRVSLDDVSTF